jgi:ribosomal protein L16
MVEARATLFLTGVVAYDIQVRMGKGKGSFDHWASRIAVSKVIFEIKGDIHEQVARDAFRLAGNKMPGKLWWPSSVLQS